MVVFCLSACLSSFPGYGLYSTRRPEWFFKNTSDRATFLRVHTKFLWCPSYKDTHDLSSLLAVWLDLFSPALPPALSPPNLALLSLLQSYWPSCYSWNFPIKFSLWILVLAEFYLQCSPTYTNRWLVLASPGSLLNCVLSESFPAFCIHSSTSLFFFLALILLLIWYTSLTCYLFFAYLFLECKGRSLWQEQCFVHCYFQYLEQCLSLLYLMSNIFVEYVNKINDKG